MSFICMGQKNDFHINGLALSLALKQRLEASRKLTIELTNLFLDFRLGAVARENFQQDIFPSLLHRYMHWIFLWVLKGLFQEIMPIQIVKTGHQIQPNLK